MQHETSHGLLHNHLAAHLHRGPSRMYSQVLCRASTCNNMLSGWMMSGDSGVPGTEEVYLVAVHLAVFEDVGGGGDAAWGQLGEG